MAMFGYGYTRQEVVDLGTDYAFQLGLLDKAYPLTLSVSVGSLADGLS